MNAPSPAHAENPYIGPYAFRVGDKLYGRDREANDLCNLLVAERIVLLLSPSGAGKTSLIQAELIPRLTNRGFHVWRPVRVRGPAAGTAMASDGTLRPNAFVQNALLSLEEELAPGERTDPADLIGVELKTYLDLRSAATATETHVLVFDQFEEILTVDPANEDDRRAFFAQVGAALRDQDRLALFALREEYWAGLEPYQDLIPGRLTTTYRLRLLDVQSATAAIANPAAAVGLPFASAAVDQLVGDLRTVRSARGGPAEVHRFVEPVQLQVVGRQLWEKLPAGISQIEPEHVAKYANVDTALENYYAEQVAAVALMYKCNVRSIRRWFDDSLISARGTRGQVRLGPEGSEGLPVAVVESLVNAYLVRKVERGEETWVELAHDRLVEPVRKNNKAWFQANLDVRERARILWEVAGGRLQVVIVLILLAIAGAAVFFAIQAIDERKNAERDRDLARSIQLAVQAGDLRASQADLALLLGAEAINVADTYEARNGLLTTIQTVPRLTRLLRNQKGDSSSVVFLDGETLASASSMGTISFWNPDGGQPREVTLAGDGSVSTTIAFSPDGSTFASGGCGKKEPKSGECIKGEIHLWYVADGQPRGKPLVGHASDVSSLAFSPDGTILASGGCGEQDPKTGKCAKSEIHLWNVADGQPRGEPLVGHASDVASIAFSPDGKSLASGSRDNSIVLWDLSTIDPGGIPRALPVKHTQGVTSLAFSSDGKTLASGGGLRDNSVILWDVATGQPLHDPLAGHTNAVTSLAFSPKGRILATGSLDGTAILWNLPTYTPLDTAPLIGQRGAVKAVAFSGDGSKLATAGCAQPAPAGAVCPQAAVQLWDVSSILEFGRILSLPSTGSQVNSLNLSTDGNLLVTNGGAAIVRWDIEPDQQQRVRLAGDGGIGTTFAFSPGGTTLASGGLDGNVRLWIVVNGQPRGEPLKGDKAAVTSLSFGPDGMILASGSQDGTIRLWNVLDGKQRGRPLIDYTGAVTSLAFGPDGKTLASVGGDGRVVLWDIAAGRPRRELAAENVQPVKSVAFSPDQKTLAAIGDTVIVLWDIATGRTRSVLHAGQFGTVTSVAFSPQDGRMLASGSQNSQVILWDLASEQPLGLPLSARYGSVWAVTFDPSGKMLAAGTANGAVVWDVGVPGWKERACRVANRLLTAEELPEYLREDPRHRNPCLA